MAPMLASRFGDWAINGRSLEHVAAKCRWFPAYGELCDHLRDWCAANRDRMPALPAPAPEPPPKPAQRTPEEMAHVAAQVARIKAMCAEVAAKRGMRAAIPEPQEPAPSTPTPRAAPAATPTRAHHLDRAALAQAYAAAGLTGPKA
jgi:hypothetical protein